VAKMAAMTLHFTVGLLKVRGVLKIFTSEINGCNGRNKVGL
jgi:hypothetical protein